MKSVTVVEPYSHFSALLARVEAGEKIAVTTIVLGELEFGAEKSAYYERNRAQLASMAQQLPLVGINAATSRQCGLDWCGPIWSDREPKLGPTIHGSRHRLWQSKPCW